MWGLFGPGTFDVLCEPQRRGHKTCTYSCAFLQRRAVVQCCCCSLSFINAIKAPKDIYVRGFTFESFCHHNRQSGGRIHDAVCLSKFHLKMLCQNLIKLSLPCPDFMICWSTQIWMTNEQAFGHFLQDQSKKCASSRH